MNSAKPSSEPPHCGPHEQLATTAFLSEEVREVVRIAVMMMMLSRLGRHRPEVRGVQEVQEGHRLVWAVASGRHIVLSSCCLFRLSILLLRDLRFAEILTTILQGIMSFSFEIVSLMFLCIWRAYRVPRYDLIQRKHLSLASTWL